MYGQSSLQILNVSNFWKFLDLDSTWLHGYMSNPAIQVNTKITGKWLLLFFKASRKTVLCTAGPQSMYMGGDLGGTIFFNPAVKTSAPQDFWSKVDGENNLFHLTWYRLLISTFGHLQSHFCFWVPNLSILSPPQPGFSLCRWAQIEALKPSETARWHNYIEYHIIYILQSSIVLTYLKYLKIS